MTLTLNQKVILSNFNWMMGAYVFRFVTGIVALSFVTRYLNPDKYGTYAYSLSIFSFIEVFLSIINQEIFKKEVIETSNKRQLVNTFFLFSSIISLALIFLTFSSLWLLDLETGDRRILIGIFTLSLLFRPADCFAYFLNVQMRNDLISRAEVASTTSFNALRIGLTFIKSTLPWFAVTLIIQKIIYSSFLYHFYYKTTQDRIIFSDFDKNAVKILLKKSFPLFLAGTSVVIFTRVDQVMIGNMLSDQDVGLYSIVVKLSESWAFIATVLAQAVYPSLVKAYNSSLSDFNHKVMKLLTILFYISLTIIAFTNIFSDTLVNLISSKEYMPASPVLRIHIFSLLFLFWQNVSNQYDIIIGAAKFTFIKTGIASVLNIVLNTILIPQLGILGASIATVISHSLASCFLNVFYSRTRSYFILQIKAFMFWETKWFS